MGSGSTHTGDCDTGSGLAGLARLLPAPTPPSTWQPLPWPRLGGLLSRTKQPQLGWLPAPAGLCGAGGRVRGSPPLSPAQAAPLCFTTPGCSLGPAPPAVPPVPTPPPSQAKPPRLLPTRLTLAAGGLGACPGRGLCGPAVRLCRRALGDSLHLLTVQGLLGREARALRPSCQLFSLCGDTGGLQVTILIQPGRQGPSFLSPGTPGRGPAPRQPATSTGGPGGFSRTVAWVGPGWYWQETTHPPGGH